MTNYTELKRLAEAASSDPLDCIYQADQVFGHFSAAANPAAVLALIAENERNQRMVLSACMSMGAIGESLGLDMDSDGDEMLGMVAELKADRDQLRAEVAGLRTGYEAYQRVNAELKAENERLRKIISDSATSCGAAVSVECSLDFMGHLPVEIFSVISKLRNALAECADSLQGEMLQKFGGQLPDEMHPVTRREYDRDMAEIAVYRAAMGKGSQS